MIQFGPLAPDQFDLNGTVARTANNVLPGPNCYLPFKSHTEITSALGAPCVGAYMALKTDGSYAIYAGTTTALYVYNQGTSTWDNVTRTVGGAYNVPSGDYWQFAQFGANLVAVNGNDAPQSINIDTPTNFAAVGGSPPTARFVAVIGDFLVLGGLASNPRRIQWSGLNNIAQWTPGTNNSDFQDFPDGGEVLAISGFENGFVLQRESVRRMQFQPTSPAVFSFERIEGARGMFAPYSNITVGETTFYYSDSGFYAVTGNQSVPIGIDQIDEYFKEEASPTYVSSMMGVADPRSTRVLWGYTSTSSNLTTFDRLIGFDWGRKRWFTADISMQVLSQGATIGTSLEGLDAFGTLETLTTSFDSPVWQGGVPALGGVSTSNKFGFFDGPAQEATIETQEAQLAPPGRAYAAGVAAYVDTSAALVAVGGRERQGDPTVYNAEQVIEVTGIAAARLSSRFHRAKIRIPAGTAWTKAAGVDFVAVPDGNR
jgi:hypothetical protein